MSELFYKRETKSNDIHISIGTKLNWTEYIYTNGIIRIIHTYKRSKLVLSQWFSKDGKIVDEITNTKHIYYDNGKVYMTHDLPNLKYERLNNLICDLLENLFNK